MPCVGPTLTRPRAWTLGNVQQNNEMRAKSQGENELTIALTIAPTVSQILVPRRALSLHRRTRATPLAVSYEPTKIHTCSHDAHQIRRLR